MGNPCKKILCIDFDGTIVEHAFPRIGTPLPNAFDVLTELKEHGYKLILWTCREDYGRNINKQYLKEAIDFCKENGVEFDAVNEPLLDYDFRPEDCIKRKVYANWYIDDRNLGGFPGWDVVREILLPVPHSKEVACI